MYSLLNKLSEYTYFLIKKHYFIHFCYLVSKLSKAFSATSNSTFHDRYLQYIWVYNQHHLLTKLQSSLIFIVFICCTMMESEMRVRVELLSQPLACPNVRIKSAREIVFICADLRSFLISEIK